MKSKLVYLGTSLLFAMTGCLGGGNPVVDLNTVKPASNSESPQLSAKPDDNAPGNLDVSQLNTQLGFSDDEESVSGASSSAITRLNSESVKSDWQFGPHLFDLTTSNHKKVQLAYNTASGGPVYAYVWYYKNGWQAMGWVYNRNNTASFNSSFDIPAGALAIYVGFFSEKGGKVTANMSFQGSTTAINSSTPQSNSSDINSKFNAVTSKYPEQLGTAKGSITAASSINGHKQDFTKGIVVLKNGASEAYAIYGKIYEKWLSDGNTQKYGAPISAITPGRTINGQSSEYQLYDKTGNPSLHAWSKGVFHFNGGIRAEWDKRYNELGHPTSDEVNGYQTFEKGSIAWSNGQAQVIIGNALTAASLKFPSTGNNWTNLTGSPFHKVGGGGCSEAREDETYALDLNLNNPSHNSDQGRAVTAIASGEVVYIKASSLGYVLIKHHQPLKLDNGEVLSPWYSGYMHMKDIPVSVGQQVTSNTEIGKIWDVGAATQYHLHFAVYKGSAHCPSKPGLVSINTKTLLKDFVKPITNWQ